MVASSGGRRPVAVDAMGGDHAPDAVVDGAVRAAGEGIPVVLVGDAPAIRALLPRKASIEVVHADDVLAMDEPAAAVRRRDQASLRVALREVVDGRASAAVSCGHSGGLVVGTMIDVGLLEGVDRPAIATVLPRSDGGRLVLLDAGATVDTRPEQMASFAVLGTAYARTLGIEEPRVALLSNGQEPGKGNRQVRDARELLEQSSLRFVGYVEPPGAFAGRCDVVVCDGFVGNVMIKAVEGAADTVLHLLKEEIRRHPSAMIGAWLLQRGLRRWRERVAWDAQGGGVLLGAREVVVVGHGRSNPAAVEAAIGLAWQAAEQGLIPRIERRLGSIPG